MLKEYEDTFVYTIAVEDLQREALKKIGRVLEEDEVEIARRGLESGIDLSLDIIYQTIFTEMIVP